MPDTDTSPHSRPRPGRLAAAVAGLASAAAGLGAAEVVAGASSRLRSPVLDVGDRVIDRVPTWLKDLAIDWFGTKDKVALLAGIWITLAVFAAVVGIGALRHRAWIGLAGVGLFALAGSAAALGARTGRDWVTPLPTLVSAVIVLAGLAACGWVIGSWPTWRQALRPERAPARVLHPSERRRFIVAVGVLTATGAAFAASGRRLQARFSAAESRAGVVLPTAREPLAAVGTSAQAPGAASFYTSNRDFYRIDTALVVPQVPAETWNLRIHGMVDDEVTLTFDELLDRELVEADITLTCVSNTVGGELIGTARWLGVRLDDLLAEAGIDPAADQIVGRSVDGYTCGFPTAALDGRPALVAVGMNGEPLPLAHGFPARLIVPGIYGYASATKWLTEIELTTFDRFDHYWVPRGYSAQAPIKIQSRIDTPRGLDRIPPGPFVIGGVAWAQPIGISAVEVRIDEGPWQPASLAADVAGTTWRQWSLPWDASPGRHSVEVRATDRNGAIQTADRSEPLPDGATGHHTVVVLVDDAA